MAPPLQCACTGEHTSQAWLLCCPAGTHPRMEVAAYRPLAILTQVRPSSLFRVVHMYLVMKLLHNATGGQVQGRCMPASPWPRHP